MWATIFFTHLHSRRSKYVSFLALSLCILLLLIIILTPTAHAAQTIPYKINFQGRLTDSSGNIMADGTYNMKLRLWTAASSGSNVWTETRGDTGGANTNRVQVTNGLFSIQLGDITALTTSLFSNGTYPLYLEVELPTPATATCTTAGCASYTEGAMTPRSALGSSAYAFNADTVDGIDGSSLARVDAGNTFTASNSYNSGTTNTFNGNLVVNNTETVTNNSLIGFNVAGTAGSYTLQANGTGGYFYTDGTNMHLGITASGSTGASRTPTSGDDDVTVISNITNGVGAAINAGMGFGTTLIDNGSFEFGMAGWRANALSGGFTYAAETANPRTGNDDLKFTKAASTDSGSLYQRMNFAQAGEVYFASAWVKTSVATNGTGGVRIIFLDKTGAVLSTNNSTTTNPGTTYTQRTVTATAPANTALMRIEPFTNGDGTTGGDWYIDDMYGVRSDRVDSPLFKNAANSTTAFQIQNASGAALLVADTTNLALKVGGGDVSPDASPALLVLDYKNTSGDPTGTNGAMYYNSNSNKFRCYENSAWRDCIQSGVTRLDFSEDFVGEGQVAPTNGYVMDQTFVYGSSGGGSASYSAGLANHPGILNFSLSYNFSSTIVGIATAFGTPHPIVFGAGAWTYTGITRLNVISNATNRYVYYLGFAADNSSAAPTNGCYLQYTDNVNSGKWQGICKKASATTTCDTGLAAATATWYDIQIAVNAAGTSATFVVNGSNTCTVSSNVPIVAISPAAIVNETAGSANMDLDYIEFSGDPLSR
jgi:hypothetical protein